MRSRRRTTGPAALRQVLVAPLLAGAVATGGPARAAWIPADAADLADRCSSPSWSEYMLCQHYLVEQARETAACGARVNGARLQLGFARYAVGRTGLAGTPADAAARRFLEQSGSCG